MSALHGQRAVAGMAVALALSLSAAAFNAAAAPAPAGSTAEADGGGRGGGSGCKSALDCSLGGQCVAGTCQCWPTWTGENCSVLNLLPAAPGPAPLNLPGAWARPGNQSSWGGSPIADPDGKRWHLFAADFANHCGLDSWQHNSQITHAVSKKLEGPFAAQDVVLAPFAHNPTVHSNPDGTYVIYHIGSGTTSASRPVMTCKNGTTPRAPSPGARLPLVPAEQPLGDGTSAMVAPSMLVSRSLDGPWARHNSSCSACASCNNPGAYVFPNGTVLLACKIMSSEENIRQMQISVAASWEGPYRVVSSTPVFGEDAYLWRAPEDGNFHMLLHSMHPGKIGTTAWSEDGITWTPAFVANKNATPGETYPSFSHTFALQGGGMFKASRRERHQLAFDSKGQPTHLLNGVVPEGMGDFSFTSVQPLNTATN